eukprot:TRINITY_DN10486_c0_g1_i2.p1 TRINITY_DN10486_c0_g1~~TRINITY_DN10486_c0_g1_i2.p1  ORF type:complete len:596 (+),score=174.11 TRINITY_DN10486_c0_g1_i2:179-1966(+)
MQTEEVTAKREREELESADGEEAPNKKGTRREEQKADRRDPLVKQEKLAGREGENCRSGRDDEVNYLDKELMVGLRKKLFNFPKSLAAHEQHNIVVKEKKAPKRFEESEANHNRRMAWSAAIALAKSDVPAVQEVLTKLASYDDVPRKEAKFVNFMRTRGKVIDKDICEQVWVILAPLRASAPLKPVEGAEGETVPQPQASNRTMVDLPCKGREKRTMDWKGKLYLAPLTTTGNMPFRRVCKDLGVDITVGEMAMAQNLLMGQPSEWALLRRHKCEDVFGVQIAAGHSDIIGPTVELLESQCELDFVDINCGCPIDLVCRKGAGSSMLLPGNVKNLEAVVKTASSVLSCPLTVKLRTGYTEKCNIAHTLIPRLVDWGAAAITLHGRSRTQRYSKMADWSYIHKAAAVSAVPLLGNGDIYTYTDYHAAIRGAEQLDEEPPPGGGLASVMIGRGALIKPWIFTEIKECRHWDISSHERLDYLSRFVNYGLEHWGSDDKGIQTTRRFLLEWMSFTHRYIPVGILGVEAARINWRPPRFTGRNDLETMMASNKVEDWLQVATLAGLPAVKDVESYKFAPKHNSYAYDREPKGGSTQVQG